MYNFDVSAKDLYNKDNLIINNAVCGFVLIVNYAQVEK